MKFYKTLNTYKASNVYFNCNTMQAYSYGWWQFVDVIDDNLIFNTYKYSNSTLNHQSKVRRLLNQLGLKVDIEIEAPKGLQAANWQADTYAYLMNEQNYLLDEIKKGRPGQRQAYRLERLKNINEQLLSLKQFK